MLRLIQLHDIGRLGAQLSAHEWAEVLDQRAAPWGLWWALPPLSLVARYYPSVPPAVLAALHDCGPAALRRLARARLIADVSYSNMSRSALPGIDWSRTPAERLSYTAERTILSVRTLLRAAQLRAPAGNQEAADPSPQAVRWHRLPPLRPATLKAVHAALASPA